MPRAYWTGQLQISLVSFGVSLYSATESNATISFHQINRATGERVKQQKTAGGEAITNDDIVKGYEYTKGQYVIIEPSELANLRVPSKHTVAVTEFIDLEALRPEHFEKSYFVGPENVSQAETYAVIRQALINTGKAAVGKITFSGREHILVIRPVNGGGLMGHTLRYQNELRSGDEVFAGLPKVAINPDMLTLAETLISRKAAKFELAKFEDGYETAVRQLVDAKLKNVPLPVEAPVKTAAKSTSLLDALKASLGGDEPVAAKKAAAPVAAKAKSSKKVVAIA